MPHWKKCYYCGSPRTIKYGYLKYGHPRWLCKKCGRTFSHNLPKTKIPFDFISFALYYIDGSRKEEKPFKIQDELSDLNKVIRLYSFPSKKDQISLSTLYSWIRKYGDPKTRVSREKANLFFWSVGRLEKINLPSVKKLGNDLLQRMIDKYGYEQAIKIVRNLSKEELKKEGMKEGTTDSPFYRISCRRNLSKLLAHIERLDEETNKLLV